MSVCIRNAASAFGGSWEDWRPSASSPEPSRNSRSTFSESGQADWPAWAPAAGAVGVIIVALAVAFGSWRFFVSVDEVEVADNLWGCLIGFYVYAILFPAWWALNKLSQVPEVNDWVVFLAAMLSSFAVYVYRKVRYT